MSKNVTLAIDEQTLEAARRYARRHHTSLNALVRQLLARHIAGDSGNWVDDCIALMDRAGGHSRRKRWRREDLYRV
ncbi:MAG: DUF6364 family protein [Planctomycetota bacterium]